MKLRTLAVVDDYHELDCIARSLVPKAKSLEIGTTLDGPRNCLMYVGVIYIGHKPTSGDISDLLFRAKIKLQ